MWRPEAKARFVSDAVDKVAAEGDIEPFRTVGRRFGSNAQGMRNSYNALAILRTARSEFSINVGHILTSRFGVWLRCMNVPGIRDFIGFGSPTSYADIQASLQRLREKELAEVVDHLTPRGKDGAALVDDSRDVSRYGRILQNTKALAMLRKRRDFDLAFEIIDKASLPDRIRKEKDRCDVLLGEIQTLDPVDQSTIDAIVDLFGVVRSMHGLTKS
jgi:hypothetical protein